MSVVYYLCILQIFNPNVIKQYLKKKEKAGVAYSGRKMDVMKFQNQSDKYC